jgi:hypothetical protein
MRGSSLVDGDDVAEPLKTTGIASGALPGRKAAIRGKMTKHGYFAEIASR